MMASFAPSPGGKRPSLATPNQLNMASTPLSARSNGETDNSLVPCTIKQLMKYESEGVLHGKNVKQVCLVGKIGAVESSETNTRFEFEDSTSKAITCTWWETTAKVEKDTYVRLVGKWIGDKSELNVYGLRALSSMNEVTLHLLDVMYSHHQRQNFAAMQVEEVKSKVEFENNQNDKKMDTGNDENDDTINSINYGKQIVDALKKADDATGYTIEEIIKVSGLKNVDLELKQSIGLLMDSGAVYCTIDDDHFMCC